LVPDSSTPNSVQGGAVQGGAVQGDAAQGDPVQGDAAQEDPDPATTGQSDGGSGSRADQDGSRTDNTHGRRAPRPADDLAGRIPAPTEPALAVTGGPSRGPGSHEPVPAGPDLSFGFGADSGDALRAPDAGSRPSASAPAQTPADLSPEPVAQRGEDRWGFLRSAATGQRLFLTGFLLLLLSIGGLVTVGIYRRRW
jgi:hypothetical protein